MVCIISSRFPDSSKFSYTPDQTYEYSYESDIRTSITGATEEHSSLHVRATAKVEVLRPCEMVLWVRTLLKNSVSKQLGAN